MRIERVRINENKRLRRIKGRNERNIKNKRKG